MTDKKYNIILADPPWHYKTWSDKNQFRSASSHYPVMKTEDICKLDVGAIAAPDCTLFIWGIWPKLPDVLQVIKAWGFTYKSCAFLWVKLSRDLWRFHMGLGHWTRANTEFCLLATKGHPKRISKSVKQLVLAPVREHSRKPDEVHHRIVDLMGDLPRIELFARRKPADSCWDIWGNEVESDLEIVRATI